MRVLVTGGSGFLGRKLIEALGAQQSMLAGGGQVLPVTEVICLDVSEYPVPTVLPFEVRYVKSDLRSESVLAAVIDQDVDIVFHLASVVSAAAESDFDLGMEVNIDGTRRLLEACRARGHRPRFVFASSVAVFSSGPADIVSDSTSVSPLTSYGAQKAICELLVGDYSRKGYVEGCALRLPTVVVRPGRPNGAASTFASSVIREPLHGVPVTCPVTQQTSIYISSPRTVVNSLLRAAQLPDATWHAGRTLNLPGIRVTLAQLTESLTLVGGADLLKLIRWERNPFVEEIVSRWPSRFDTTRALSLGFAKDYDAAQIIRQFIEDEMGRAE